MAIRPQYSAAILNGSKLVEFRKRPLAADIDRVLIYETAPTQRVVGTFIVGRTVSTSPAELWKQFGHVGQIDSSEYARYFDGSAKAVGLTVQSYYRFTAPVALQELYPAPSIPQSFVYVSADVIDQIDAIQHDRAPGSVRTAARWVLRPAARLARSAVAGPRPQLVP
jgi:predicted transcriptional regulator